MTPPLRNAPRYLAILLMPSLKKIWAIPYPKPILLSTKYGNIKLNKTVSFSLFT